jgi:C-terminal processing protease CtpA/Prc
MEGSHLPVIGEIEEAIYYVSLSKASMSQIDEELEKIAAAKGVIFDLRGYPNSNHQVISHLLTEPDTSNQWRKTPKVIYPDQKKFLGYENYGWNLKPAEPHIQGKVVFLTDARAVSYAEAVLSFIEHYDLAEIVGQPTGGVNGVTNTLLLPGRYFTTWTGKRIVKHDGSQHHLIGIQPTNPVNKTIQGVRDGQDEFMEKALEILRQ